MTLTSRLETMKASMAFVQLTVTYGIASLFCLLLTLISRIS